MNGTYQDDGSQYEPMTSIPAWVWVLVAISVIGGWFFGGLLCLVIGAALSTVYISASLQKNNTKVIIAFVGFLVIAAVFFVLNMLLVGATSMM